MKCITNPKTGKPFSNHKLVSEPQVQGYYKGAYGDDKPIFSYNVKCLREGCKR